MRLFVSALRLAWLGVTRNKLRATLTALGILIGVAAVVVVTALAGGASEKVGGEIASFAANALYVSPQAVQQSGVRDKGQGRLTEADARAVAREAVSVAATSPWLSTQAIVSAGERNTPTMVAGVTLPYFAIRRFDVKRGALWTEGDELLKTKVCVVGQTVAERLFGSDDPVGRRVRIGQHSFRVLGVLVSRGTSTFGDDQDDRILMPIGSLAARVRKVPPGRVDMFMASARSPEVTKRAERQITEILRQRHRIADGAEPDFSVRAQKELLDLQEKVSGVLSALLLGVATVSLVVGGIGVMNIMLVSVAERTREIGIRLSIGARRRDILLQFLVEAVVLCLGGGFLGVLLGGSVTVLAGRALGWNAWPTPLSVLVATATSFVIGTVFGWLPAFRASRLDPVEALRTE